MTHGLTPEVVQGNAGAPEGFRDLSAAPKQSAEFLLKIQQVLRKLRVFFEHENVSSAELVRSIPVERRSEP
jgi:hypothetical protein